MALPQFSTKKPKPTVKKPQLVFAIKNKKKKPIQKRRVIKKRIKEQYGKSDATEGITCLWSFMVRLQVLLLFKGTGGTHVFLSSAAVT